jgi:hypothetical protein
LAKVFLLQRKSTLALRQRREWLLRSTKIPRDLLRASFVERFTTCGKPNCCCARGKRHGPFYYLAAGLKAGNVRKFLLKTAAQQAFARHGVAAYQAFWDQLEELSQINAELLRRGEPLESEPA